jgi:hypothetical protein
MPAVQKNTFRQKKCNALYEFLIHQVSFAKCFRSCQQRQSVSVHGKHLFCQEVSCHSCEHPACQLEQVLGTSCLRLHSCRLIRYQSAMLPKGSLSADILSLIPSRACRHLNNDIGEAILSALRRNICGGGNVDLNQRDSTVAATGTSMSKSNRAKWHRPLWSSHTWNKA